MPLQVCLNIVNNNVGLAITMPPRQKFEKNEILQNVLKLYVCYNTIILNNLCSYLPFLSAIF